MNPLNTSGGALGRRLILLLVFLSVLAMIAVLTWLAAPLVWPLLRSVLRLLA